RKAFTRRSDELALKRQALPWVPIEKDYCFETEDGKKTLADIFDGRSQLLVYHFMFGPTVEGWPEAGCPGCSYTADSLDGAVVHLPPRGVTFVAVSRAPLENLQAYERRMGWAFPWVSAAGSDFNLDFAVFTEEGRKTGTGFNFGTPKHAAEIDLRRDELHGLSAFVLEDGVVYHTYSCYDRGQASLAADGTDRQGLCLRRAGRQGRPARHVRRAQAAAPRPLHVRAESGCRLRRLLDVRRPDWSPRPPARPRHVLCARVPRP